MKKHLYFLLLFPWLNGCQPDSMHPQEYVRWMMDPANGFIQNRTIGDIQVEVMYQPPELIALNEVEPDMSEQMDDGFKKRVKELQGDYHFKLRFTPTDHKTDFLKTRITNQSEYYARLQYLTSGFQQDVTLFNGTDTVLCSLHHFERAFHLTPNGDISLVFERTPKEIKNNLILIYDDHIFNLGVLQFVFPAESLLNAPKPFLN